MGLGQGSRGAPDAWLQVSSPIFNILRKVGYGAQFENPITHEEVVSVGSAFVDDANMYVFGKHLDTVSKLYAEAVEHVSAWATMLLVTGGCVKVRKSYLWVIAHVYDEETGRWRLKKTEGMPMEVEGDDGVKTEVTSLPMDDEQKFLGVHDAPAGGNAKEIEEKKGKVETFVQRMSNGKLPSFLGWMAYRYKLWASIRYGLGTMTNDIEDVDTLLDKTDHKMMNILGVASTIMKGWRKLHSTFGGIGLYNFVTKQLIERLYLLLQH